jgi:CBS domain-containing protein
MASNIKWRQPLKQWQLYFKQWINQPEPKALMYASIFFDLRCIYGDLNLLTTLQNNVFEMTQRSSLFLHLMATNALHYRPPLGLFRNFVLEKTGAEAKALNMKKRGVVPIIDLARVYALEAGSTVINTQERLKAAYEGGKLSKEGMEDLRDAFEFIGTVRLQHQARQIENGKMADNHVPPEELSSLERRHLKDAFEVVSTLQTVLERRFQ